MNATERAYFSRFSRFDVAKQLFSRRSSLANPERWLEDAFGVTPSESGVTVNEVTALNYSAVYACVRVLAETISSLPCILYRRLERGKERAVDHRLYPVLHDQPNPEMTSMQWFETMMGHLCLWGNCYSEIVEDGGGRVRELWPFRPDRVRIERKNGVLLYHVTVPTVGEITLPASKVLHIPGLSFDGIKGYPPIRLARESIGLGLATEQFGARFFGTGTHPGIIVEHPGDLGDIAHENLRKSLTKNLSGLGKSHRLLILEEGMTWKQVGIPPEDAQFLATREFQVVDMCRIFRVPPYKVQDFSRATFNNVEHVSISFVVDSIRPWLVRWEQALRMKLLTPTERKTLFAEFLVEGLLRGDTKTRYEAYAIGRQNGWLTANMILELENQNPVEGGDTLYMPLNMTPVDSNGAVPERAQRTEVRALEAKPGIVRARLAEAYLSVYANAARRLVGGEVKDIRRAMKQHLKIRSADSFREWVGQYYREKVPDRVAATMKPVVYSFTEAIQAEVASEIGADAPGMTPEMQKHVEAYTEIMAEQHVNYGEARIIAAIAEEEVEALERELEQWEENRADKIAMKESVETNGVMTRIVLGSLGVLVMRWAAIGPQPCPYCTNMDGTIVSITGMFAKAGDTLEPEGQEPMRISMNVSNPPLHGGCACAIVAG